MLTFLVPLMMPILAMATIHIDIKAANTYRDTSVTVYGYSESVITDTDREIFKIGGDWELKQAVHMLSGGMLPDDVYVKSPTPWGDLYSTWNWPEVTRKILPKYVKILDITSETVDVAKKHIKNNSKHPSEYSGALTQQDDMYVKNSWISGEASSFGEQISYSVWMDFGSTGKSRSITYRNLCGQEHTETSGVSIGSDLPVQANLEPKQAVDMVLRATRVVVRLEVTYEVTLSGTVAANYAGKFKGHHFWGYGVNECLEAAGKPRKINFKEEIEVVFYINESVTSS